SRAGRARVPTGCRARYCATCSASQGMWPRVLYWYFLTWAVGSTSISSSSRASPHSALNIFRMWFGGGLAGMGVVGVVLGDGVGLRRHDRLDVLAPHVDDQVLAVLLPQVLQDRQV